MDFLDGPSVGLGILIGVLITLVVRAYLDEAAEIEEASKWE